jgi:hypothetical protein
MIDKVSAKFIEMIEECANTPERLDEVRGRWMEPVAPVTGNEEFYQVIEVLDEMDNERNILYKNQWYTRKEYTRVLMLEEFERRNKE